MDPTRFHSSVHNISISPSAGAFENAHCPELVLPVPEIDAEKTAVAVWPRNY
jgi:hypothetical protein